MYWDTSALIKLVLDEQGSDVAERLWDRADQVLTCRLAYPEARAALAAAWRDDRLNTSEHVQAIDELDGLIAELAVIEVDARIAQDAGGLADRLALRGADAVHLASALAIGDRNLVFAAWDQRLAWAAMGKVRGLTVVPMPER